MSLRSWLRTAFARLATRPIRKAPPKARPAVEALEDRMVLSTYTASNVSELIASMTAANQSAEADTITLAPGTTFSLTAVDNVTNGSNGLPVIVADGGALTIVGNGDTIERSTAAGTPAFRLFEVAGGGSLTLENLTLTGGLALGRGAAAAGGAVYSAGTLALSGVTVTSNTAQGGDPNPFSQSDSIGFGAFAYGGGVHVAGGTATLTNDIFSGNHAVGGVGANGSRDTLDFYHGKGGFGGSGSGGGLSVLGGTATLTNVTLSGNTAAGGPGGPPVGDWSAGGGGGGPGGSGHGGGLFVQSAAVTLTNVTLSGNTAAGGAGSNGIDPIFFTFAASPGGDGGDGIGGALTASAATVTLTNVTLSGNTAAGGRGGDGGSGSFDLSGESAGDGGAGIGGGLSVAGSTATLTNCTFSGNTAAGAAGGNGGFGMAGFAWAGNGGAGSGGGLYQAGGTTTLTNDTFGGNTAAGGHGGHGGDGRPPVGSGNGGAGSGGGLYQAGGTATLTNDTFGGNTAAGGTAEPGNNPGKGFGGGLFLSDSIGLLSTLPHTTYLASTLIAQNTVLGGEALGGYALGLDVYGSVASSDHNLIGDSRFFSAAISDGDILDPSAVGLAGLANNGGPTQTMALLAGSPAIDAGINALIPVGVTTDQRGPGFTRISNGTVDIGAFEVQVQAIATTTAVATSATASTYGGSVTFTATVTSASTPTGSVHFVIDSGTPVVGTAGGTTGTTATWTFTTSTLAAGVHTIRACFDGSDNFEDSDGTLNGGQMVTKADATVVVAPYSVTYDGAEHTATYTIAGVNGEEGAAVGSVDLSSTAHTNASTYSDSWSFTGSANYNDVTGTVISTIAKADATVVGLPYRVTYDGSPHTAVASITGVNGETGATVGTVDLSHTTHTNAGTHSGSWSFTGTANYNDIAATSITNTIAKASASIALTLYSVTYDGLPHTAAVASITGVNGESGTTVGTVDVSSTTHTDAGTYTDSWSFTGGPNYHDIAAMPITNSITNTITNANAKPAAVELRQNRPLLEIVGPPGQEVPVKVTLTRLQSALTSEIGFFALDATGKVNGLAPGQRGFLRTALRSARRRVVFGRGRRAGLAKVLKQFTGQQLIFYIIPNGGPHVFTAMPGANPDRVNHVRISPLGGSRFRLAWEDMFGGGDRDFNDVVLEVSLGR